MRFSTNGDRFFRNRIRKLREQAGLTQADMAERSGFSLLYYQNIEAGRRTNTPLHTIEKIATALEISLHEVFAKTPPVMVRIKSTAPPHYKNPRSKRRR
ncbi:MAG: helix-turn-helix transcriptional regulator [Verrucomicrobiales bacterium]|jgi:transcriptional regulator with XRE-family HTH domain|nr:helix-turn-helix transcriptional regulator [Verrucomicrobiales bacterium]